MTSNRIIAVKVLDSDAHILVKTTSLSTDALDLKLEATDELAVFLGETSQSSCATLKLGDTSISDEEWCEVLSYLLSPSALDPEHKTVPDVELVATVHASHVSLFARKTVSGIAQRIGQIDLQKDESEETEIGLFEWAHIATSASVFQRKRIDELTERVENLQTSSETHRQLLNDLTSARDEDQAQLFTKFALLLNAKKLKIRDQQRLLAHAKINAQTAKQVQSARSGSRIGGNAKRKAVEEVQSEYDVESEDEQAAETPDVSEDEGSGNVHDEFAQSLPDLDEDMRVRLNAKNEPAPNPAMPVSGDQNSSQGPRSQPQIAMEHASSAPQASANNDDDDDETDDEL